MFCAILYTVHGRSLYLWSAVDPDEQSEQPQEGESLAGPSSGLSLQQQGLRDMLHRASQHYTFFDADPETKKKGGSKGGGKRKAMDDDDDD